MRVTGGRARGVPLKAGKDDRIRPATDRMREAVFSSLGPVVDGARFLDLFAGTGAYGLEALSRGAAGGVFVEKDRRAVALLEHNLAAVRKSLGLHGREVRVLAGDVFTVQLPESFDLIFVDPPYELIPSRANAVFALAENVLRRDSETRLCFEHPGGLELGATGWRRIRQLGGNGHQPAMSIFVRDVLEA